MEDAWRAYGLLERMAGRNIVLEPELDYLRGALEIALRYGVTVYDVLYISQVLSRGLSLLSLDEGQRRVAAGLGVAVRP